MNGWKMVVSYICFYILLVVGKTVFSITMELQSLTTQPRTSSQFRPNKNRIQTYCQELGITGKYPLYSEKKRSYICGPGRVLDLDQYRIVWGKNLCQIYKLGGESLIEGISFQFLIAHREDNNRVIRENFIFHLPVVKKKFHIFTLHGTGFFEKKFIYDNKSMYKIKFLLKYSIIFNTLTGRLFIESYYINNGDSFYIRPYAIIKLPYKNIKGYKWLLFSNKDDRIKDGRWPVEKKYGLISVISTGLGRFKEPQVSRGLFFYSSKEALQISVPSEMHLRLHGDGSCIIYNKNYASRAFYPLSYYNRYHIGWRLFEKDTQCELKAKIVLSKIINCRRTKIRNKLEEKDSKLGVHIKRKAIIKNSNKCTRIFSLAARRIENKKFVCNSSCIGNKLGEKVRQLRPIIKNGTFYFNEKPVYMIGAWLDLHYRDANRPIPIPEYSSDIAYNHYFTKEIAIQKGFNTCHPPMLFWFTCKKFSPRSKKALQQSNIYKGKYFPIAIRGLKDLPLVLDFADIKWYCKEFPSELYQKNPHWHAFVPFCPDCKEGSEIYKYYWQTATRRLLALGANPWIYELFNEPAYECRCKENKRLFFDFLKKKYKTINGLNKVLASKFNNFQELNMFINNNRFEESKGLWVEWIKFIEDRWCAILLQAKRWIKKIDKRSNIYFSCQRAIALSFLTTFNGFDEYKVARVMDVVNTEGGLSFFEGRTFYDNNPMEAHQHASMRMQLDLARAAAEDKPVIDTEQSTKRFDIDGKRIPSLRKDLNLMLWNEAIHGASCTQIYAWVKRQWEWPSPNLEGAKQFINAPNRSWAYASLLNPYCYPEGTLKGIEDFKKEMQLLSNLILPRPRIHGSIALLLSNPSRRFKKNISLQFIQYYRALSGTDYPLDIIFEEQLSKGYATKYKAIISPICEYCYQDTPLILEKYIRAGGNLILQGMDLIFDEYGKKIKSLNVIGVSQRKLSHPLPVSFYLQNRKVTGSLMTFIKPENKCNIIFKDLKHGFPLLSEYSYGKGKTFVFSFKPTHNRDLAEICNFILEKKCSIEKPFSLARRKLGDFTSNIEIQLIDRERKKLYYIVNWKNITEIICLNINLSPGLYYVIDPLNNSLFLNKKEELRWSAYQLNKDGLKICLPPEAKQFILITKKRPTKIRRKISQAKIECKYTKQINKDRSRVKKILNQYKKKKEDKIKKNSFLDVKVSKCFTVDISKYCNMGFRDEIAGDERGGAFDQGQNDFRNIPTGNVKFCNIPFKIIRPEENNGKSMIVLKGRNKITFPQEIKGILVDKKVKRLFFLHTIGWEKGKFQYIINYQDGSQYRIMIRSGFEVGGWWDPEPKKAIDAKVAWEGRNPIHSKIGIYCYCWNNPFPDHTIKTIDIKSFNEEILPAVIAISGELYP